MTTLENLGRAIRKLRNFRQLTIEQLADSVGVCAKTLQGWELGRGHIRVLDMIQLAQFFQVPENFLLEVASGALKVPERCLKCAHLKKRRAAEKARYLARKREQREAMLRRAGASRNPKHTSGS